MPLVETAIVAGAGLLGQGIGAASNANINKKTRKWNEKMHNLQRQEALADYAMQNAYNHPSSQMARLREARLNPNLVYGNGATTEGGTVRPAPVESWNPKPTEIDLGSVARDSIQTYQQVKMQEAQVDNLRTQNNVMEADIILKKAQEIATLAAAKKTAVDTVGSGLSNALNEAIQDYQIQLKAGEVEKQKADTKFTLDSNERAAVMQSSNLKEAAMRIAQMRLGQAKTKAEIEHIKQLIVNLKTTNRLDNMEADLRDKGMDKAPWWVRIIGRLFNFGEDDKDNKTPEANPQFKNQLQKN